MKIYFKIIILTKTNNLSRFGILDLELCQN